MRACAAVVEAAAAKRRGAVFRRPRACLAPGSPRFGLPLTIPCLVVWPAPAAPPSSTRVLSRPCFSSVGNPASRPAPRFLPSSIQRLGPPLNFFFPRRSRVLACPCLALPMLCCRRRPRVPACPCFLPALDPASWSLPCFASVVDPAHCSALVPLSPLFPLLGLPCLAVVVDPDPPPLFSRLGLPLHWVSKPVFWPARTPSRS